MDKNKAKEKQKVFGIGWAKTGTTTLGECFKILGFSHLSQRLDLVSNYYKKDMNEIFKLVNNFDSFEDFPWNIMYKELDEKYPNSKFILTKRNSEDWMRSYTNMVKNEKNSPSEERKLLYGEASVFGNEEKFLKRYLKHNKEILDYFKNRDNDLLIVDWSKGDGWKEICNFLDKDTPNKKFPHANKGSYKK
jgi:hypothetical protein